MGYFFDLPKNKENGEIENDRGCPYPTYRHICVVPFVWMDRRDNSPSLTLDPASDGPFRRMRKRRGRKRMRRRRRKRRSRTGTWRARLHIVSLSLSKYLS